MIPAGAFTASPVSGAFLAPLTDAYQALTMRAPGGVAIGDPSQGRQVQFWTVTYETGVIRVAPPSGVPAFSLAVAGVLAVSLAFDTNMAVTLGYMTAAGARLYYFSSLLGNYTTLAIDGATSCRVGVDDPREFYAAQSDVIFAYTLGGTLYYRQQRDRYATAYTVGSTTGKLLRMGPSVQNRLQFELL